jgi:hypothetical protein
MSARERPNISRDGRTSIVLRSIYSISATGPNYYEISEGSERRKIKEERTKGNRARAANKCRQWGRPLKRNEVHANLTHARNKKHAPDQLHIAPSRVDHAEQGRECQVK